MYNHIINAVYIIYKLYFVLHYKMLSMFPQITPLGVFYILIMNYYLDFLYLIRNYLVCNNKLIFIVQSIH